jgi:hypothetical protein
MRIGIYGLALFILMGCNQAPVIPEVRPEIAQGFDEFYDQSITNPSGARAALESARSFDRENGYPDYLEAHLAIAKKDYAEMLRLMRAGNEKKSVTVYVSLPTPNDNMKSLGRLRQVGFATAQFKEFDEFAPELFVEARKMGSRVTLAEPVCTFTVVNGSALYRRVCQSELEYYKFKKDAAQAKVAQARLGAANSWYDKFKTEFELTDIMREAGKAAGMSESELMAYAQGRPVARAKAEAADRKRDEIYAAEVKSLREFLKSFPSEE